MNKVKKSTGMYLNVIHLFLSLLISVPGTNIDCLEGEMWFEPCQYCKCLKENRYTCEHNVLSCRLGKCVKDVVVFQNNIRCHCAENNATICVPLHYQDELHGKSCSEDFYYYDSCTFCKCDKKSKTLQCTPTRNCKLSNGGICNDGEVVFEDNCYSCNCSFTKFRKCIVSQDCLLEKEKPGNCYIVQNYFNLMVQYMCVSIIKQECYTDYDCPGHKKCCHVVDCYLQCVDPLFD